MPIHKKKIFVLFSGELRLFPENFSSINKYLKEYEKFFLFYPWDHESKKIKYFQALYGIYKLNYIYQKNWDKYIKRIKYPDTASNIPSLFYMWDALLQSFLNIKSTLNENDLILRFRTDIKINSKKFFLNLDNIKDDTLYIPDRYHWNGINDQVFFTKVKTLKKFSNFFEFVENSINKNEFISPEYIFYKFIKKEKIKIIFFDLDYQLLRNKKKESTNKKMSYIPFKDKIIIKYLKITYKFRNFKKFYLEKKKRNKVQNYFYES